MSAEEIVKNPGVDAYWTASLGLEEGLLKRAIDQLWKEQEPFLYLPAWLETQACASLEQSLDVLKAQLEDERLKEIFSLKTSWLVLRRFEERVGRFLERFNQRLDLKEKLQNVEIDVSALRDKQKEAVLTSLEASTFILTGGPGTGKTYTCRLIVEALCRGLQVNRPCKVALLAPTGKAMVRLEQSMQGLENKLPLTFETMTLHRLLSKGLSYEASQDFNKDPWAFDIMLVDEASMVTLSLFEKLIEKIDPKTRLVLIGDPYQLPPVDSMPVFERLVEMAKAKQGWVHLEECLRIENRALFDVSRAILQSQTQEHVLALKQQLQEPPLQLARFSHNVDFMTQIAPQFPWLSLLKEADPEPGKIFSLLNKWICLCSTKTGPMGTEAINQLLYQRLRFEILQKRSRGLVWIPVMATVNQKELERVNGEMGLLALEFSQVLQTPLLSKAMAKAGQVLFLKGESIQAISPLRVESLVPAWAMTIHKSQGSEFEHVECLVSDRFHQEQARALLYTACTRAKRGLRLWQLSDCLEEMLQPSSSLEKSWLFSI